MSMDRWNHGSSEHLASSWRLVLPVVVWLLLAAGVEGAHAQDGTGESKNPGLDVYEASCVGCHQAGGRGVEGVFPSLRENELVQGPLEPLLIVVLEGRAAMPGFGATLSDRQIAAVLSYLRSNWGNDAGHIRTGEIADMRRDLPIAQPRVQRGR